MYIIDGHNLLHAIHKTDEAAQLISDSGLCRILGSYLKIIGETGEVVFDGTGPRDKSEFEKIEDIEYFFSGSGTDADTIIEKKIKVNSAPKRLTIVSSDRRLRRAARTRKASVIKSEDFWVRIQKQLERKKTVKREPGAKRHGLSKSETERWLDIFEIER